MCLTWYAEKWNAIVIYLLRSQHKVETMQRELSEAHAKLTRLEMLATTSSLEVYFASFPHPNIRILQRASHGHSSRCF